MVLRIPTPYVVFSVIGTIGAGSVLLKYLLILIIISSIIVK